MGSHELSGHSAVDKRGVFEVLFSEGRNLISFTGLILLFAGLLIITQSFIGEFLPHDTNYLGMNAVELGLISQEVVNFIFHDRVSFGGTLISIGILYIWLSEFPLRSKKAWSWWLLFISGIIGFSSFLTYLGYGYLDTYHGVASLLLIPIFFYGLYRSYHSFPEKPAMKSLSITTFKPDLKSPLGWGYVLLYFTAAGIFLGGTVIMVVGMTSVYVPQDLSYMKLCSSDFDQINPNLTPLIAHDRASFGGGLACIGFVIFFIIKCAVPSKNLWQVLFIALSIGFITAIGIHYYIGYLSFIHLAPAYFGALIFIFGISLTRKFMMTQ